MNSKVAYCVWGARSGIQKAHPCIGKSKVHGCKDKSDGNACLQIGEHDSQICAPQQDELNIQDLHTRNYPFKMQLLPCMICIITYQHKQSKQVTAYSIPTSTNS